MGTRVGIELSPVACRLIELEGRPLERGQPPDTCVRSFAVLPRSGPETDRRLASIGRRPAAVIVWGARSDHRQVVVSKGSYDQMRAEAIASARDAGVDTQGALADIAGALTAIQGAARQPVVLALASGHDVSAAVRPLVAAGVRIRSVITPADALLSLARSRQAFAVPGGIEAYVALDETATCVALVRDGSLLSARELPWGYRDRSAAPTRQDAALSLSRSDDLAARLADELRAFLATVGAASGALTQVSICGALPDLRTMTVPLMERLDVEVETLDSLFGIAVEHLPEPAEEFREQAAALKLAWAAAADWRGPIDLMRHRRRRAARVALARAAVVAGVAAGLGAGWEIEQSQWWRSTAPRPVQRRTPPTATASAKPRATAVPAKPPATTTPAEPLAATAPRPETPVVAVLKPLSLPAPEPRSAPQAALTKPPAATPPAGGVAPPVVARLVPPPQTGRPTPSPVAPPTIATNPPARTVERVPAEEPPVPFDAALVTILYSPDRKLAIVNGRIVGLGDEVNGATIVDITPRAVLLRDAQGRLRSLTLGTAARSGPTP